MQGVERGQGRVRLTKHQEMASTTGEMKAVSMGFSVFCAKVKKF